VYDHSSMEMYIINLTHVNLKGIKVSKRSIYPIVG